MPVPRVFAKKHSLFAKLVYIQHVHLIYTELDIGLSCFLVMQNPDWWLEFRVCWNCFEKIYIFIFYLVTYIEVGYILISSTLNNIDV